MVDANIDQQMEDILNVTGDDPLSDAMGDRLITQQTDNIAEDIGDVATDVIRSLDVPEMAMRYQDAMNYEPMSNTERLLRIFPAADIIGAGVGSGAKAPINALASNAIRREAKKDTVKAQVKDLKEKFGFKQDNPVTYSGVQGEDWLVEKMRMAADTGDPTRLRGSVTATLGKQKGKDMYLPVDMLKNLKGARGEIRGPGEYQYERLLKDVKKEGFDPTQKGFKINIGVNAGGQPYIIEGNTRVRVASDLNVPYVRVEVNYFNGGEMRGAEGYENLKHLEYFYPTKSTSFSPDNVISVAKTSDEIINTLPKKDIIKPQGRGLDIQFADYVKQALEAQGKIELPDGIIISEAPFKYSDDIIKMVATSYQNKINIGFDSGKIGGLDTIKGLTPARKAELGKKVPEGKLVAVRPNLNSDINDDAVPIPKIGKPDEPKKQPLLSVQEGGKVKGTVYSDQPYVLVNPTKDKGVVSFTVDQELRAKVAGGENKDRLMAVRGEYTEYDISKFSINNRKVVEIKFNPALQHLAIRADTNEALVGSKGKVLVIADRIYALKDDLIYARKRDAPKALGGHDTNVVYRLNKGGLLDDQMEDILNVEGVTSSEVPIESAIDAALDDPLTDAQTDALGVYRGEPERDPRLIAQETDMLLDVAGGKENPEYGPMYGGPDKKLDSQDALALFFPPIPGIDPIFGETKKAFEEGRYGTGLTYAALTLLGIIPGAKTVTKPAAKKLSREVTERVEPVVSSKKPKSPPEKTNFTGENVYNLRPAMSSFDEIDMPRIEASNYHYSSKIGNYINDLYEKNPNGTITIADLKRDFGLGKRPNPNAFPKDQTVYHGIKNLIEEAEKEIVGTPKKSIGPQKNKQTVISIADLKNRFDNNQVVFEEYLYTSPDTLFTSSNPLIRGENLHLGDGFDIHSSNKSGNYEVSAPSALNDEGGFVFDNEHEVALLEPIGQADPKKYKELVIGVKGKTKARKASKEEIRQGFYVDDKGFRRPFTSEAQEGMDIPMRVDRSYVKSSHFPDAENPISHSRFTTDVDMDGERTFVVDEIQNDPFRDGIKVNEYSNKGMDTGLENAYDTILAGNQDNFEDRVTEIIRAGPSSNIKNAIPVPSETNFYLNKKLDNAIENRLKAEGRLRPDGKIEPTVEEYRYASPDFDPIRSQEYQEAKGIVESPTYRKQRPQLPLSEKIKNFPKDIDPNLETPKQWAEVTVKRLLIEAIESGSDQFAWTTGATQMARNGGTFPEQAVDFYDSGIGNILLKIGKEHGLTKKDFIGKKTITTGKFKITDVDLPADVLLGMAQKAVLELEDIPLKQDFGLRTRMGLPNNVDPIGNLSDDVAYEMMERLRSNAYNPLYEEALTMLRIGKPIDPALEKSIIKDSREIINLYGANHPHTVKSEVFVMRIPEELKKAYSGLKEGTIEFNKGGTIDKEMGQLFAN